MTPDETRRALLESGWRQGSILQEALCREVVPILDGFEAPQSNDAWPAKRRYIIVSQDCDIASGNFDTDPTIEVVLATKVSKQKAQFQYLRSSRMLHISIMTPDGDDLPHEIRVGQRGFLRHELLLDHAPDSQTITPQTTQQIAALISRRYLRDVKPETFDARIGSSRRAKFDVLLAAEDGIIFDVLFEIKPADRELTQGTPYQVSVVGVLSYECDARPRALYELKIAQLKDEIRHILSDCDDIELENVEILGRSEISLLRREGLRSLEIVWPRFMPELSNHEDEDQ